MPPGEELIAATRQAIADATNFDDREINYNLDYDHRAYEEVKRNFLHLVDLGQWASLMELALELMRKGSYQVAMSDEGMMTDEIVECLHVAIQAFTKADLPRQEVAAWCADMTFADQIGFICDRSYARCGNTSTPPHNDRPAPSATVAPAARLGAR